MDNSTAPSAQWRHPVWSTAQKDLVGTALGHSRLWFTVGKGILTEVFYPRVDIPQIRDLDFIIADGQGFWAEIKTQANYDLTIEDPSIPIPIIRHQQERFTFTLTICVDPLRDVLLIDYTLEGDETLSPYLLCSARLGEDAIHNEAWLSNWAGRPVLWAEQGPFGLAITARDKNGEDALLRASVGEVGASDLWQDFAQNGTMRWQYDHAGPGEVALGAQLTRKGTIALGLSTSKEAAATLAWQSLLDGFSTVRAAYTAGWRQWHGQHQSFAPLKRKLSAAAFALFQRSANVLKVHLDHNFPGAIVASLSVPWGEASDSLGGYHLVWSRDLVESAGALLALGATQEARQVLIYLASTQQSDGHWLQNQWLGGKPFWSGIQLDEAGFPVILAGALAAAGALEDTPVHEMVTRALQFIVERGPATDQDRWEEDGGINTFTLSVAIAALVEGHLFLEGKASELALMVADYWNAHLEDWTFIRDTALAKKLAVPGYFIRITPGDVLNGADAEAEWVMIKNRAQDPHLPANEQVATDFLQICRYGLRKADDPHIVSTIKVIDSLLKTDTPSGPVWHRYNGDGYGEHADGSPFDGCGIGRGWPLLTGERGHYALLAGEKPLPYIEAMAKMTGKGGLLPEQIWDSDPLADKDLFPGKPSGSAMPLVWAHGEYVKLCASLLAGQPVDRPAATWKRYQGKRPKIDFTLWRLQHKPRRLTVGHELRLLLSRPCVIHWSINGWDKPQDTATEDWTLGHLACLPTRKLNVGDTVHFTLYWPEDDRWQGENYALEVIHAQNTGEKS